MPFQSDDMFRLIRGMTQEVPAHIPLNISVITPKGDNQYWYETHNARFRHGKIQQIGRLTSFLTLPGGDTTPITNISGFSGQQTLFTAQGLYTLDFAAGTATFVTQPVGFVVDPSNHYRWAVVQSQPFTYYTNPFNKIISYDGSTAIFDWDGMAPEYGAKYMIDFYQHLVVANVTDSVTNYPLRLAWSDIDQFNVFEPTITNEADSFDIPDSRINSIFNLGITGLCQVGSVLAIFTPGSIYNMTYVGFDNGVMQIDPQIQGIGNFLPYAVIGMDKYAAFISFEDIYVYDGNTVTPIGGPIRDFFFGNLSMDPNVRNNTWGYIEQDKQELRWYFPSRTSTGLCDLCIAFNWQTQDWYIEDGQGITAALSVGGGSLRTIDQLTSLAATIDDLTSISPTIDGLSFVNLWPHALYATSGTGMLASELTDTSGTLQVSLESRDMLIADDELVKELDTMLVDADNNPIDSTKPSGWNVFVSVRQYVRDPVNYDFAGLWTGNESESRLTALRTRGRVFRFKFVSQNLCNSAFYGFSPNFNTINTEN